MKLKQVLGKKVQILFTGMSVKDGHIEGILEFVGCDGVIISQEQQDDFLYEFIPMKRIQSINWNVKKIEEENENGNQT